jgi:hypothetical protein
MKRYKVEDLGINERMILISILKIDYEIVRWICVAQHWNQWRAFVNTVFSLQVP